MINTVIRRSARNRSSRRAPLLAGLLTVALLSVACDSTISGAAEPLPGPAVSGALVEDSTGVRPFPSAETSPTVGVAPGVSPQVSAVASSGAADPTPAVGGPTVGAAPTGVGPAPDTVVAPAAPLSDMPTVSGSFGTKPTLTFPGATPPSGLQRKILTAGTGAVVGKDDYLVTNYLGAVWSGKTFDDSYDRSATSTFQIGAGKVIRGWDVALVGMKVGSRVLLSIPPVDGYGSAGGAGGAITGTDTIVYVVDIVARIPWNATGQTNAVPQAAPLGLPTVTGALGREPKISIGKNLIEPTVNSVHILARGTGAAARAGSLLCQLVVTDWKQSQTQSTWSDKATPADASSQGLQQITVDSTGALKGLIGVPLGSRVLVVIAARTDSSTGQTSAAAVAVLDVVAQA